MPAMRLPAALTRRESPDLSLHFASCFVIRWLCCRQSPGRTLDTSLQAEEKIMRIALAPILAGIAFLTLTACTSVPSVGEIPASIANATTAAEHQRIAAYF